MSNHIVTGAAASHRTVAWMKKHPSMTQTALEQRARRVARRLGLRISKSRLSGRGIDDAGTFRILENGNIITWGLSPEEGIEYCANRK